MFKPPVQVLVEHHQLRFGTAEVEQCIDGTRLPIHDATSLKRETSTIMQFREYRTGTGNFHEKLADNSSDPVY